MRIWTHTGSFSGLVIDNCLDGIPKFRGIDLVALFKDAGDKVAAASSATEVIHVITNTLVQFGDSHTRFYPPSRATRADYGGDMVAVGEDVLVTRVDPCSDAAARGLAAGDRVQMLNRLKQTRANLRQIQHYYRAVRPQPSSASSSRNRTAANGCLMSDRRWSGDRSSESPTRLTKPSTG